MLTESQIYEKFKQWLLENQFKGVQFHNGVSFPTFTMKYESSTVGIQIIFFDNMSRTKEKIIATFSHTNNKKNDFGYVWLFFINPRGGFQPKDEDLISNYLRDYSNCAYEVTFAYIDSGGELIIN